MALKFGDIHLLRKYAPKPALKGHYVVVLHADTTTNIVYFQSLSSRIYNVFPNFGSWKNITCLNCSDGSPDFQKWQLKKVGGNFLDVDTITFLNYRKYPKLISRETYVCLQKVEKDNLFDFNSKIQGGIYPCKGNLLQQNKKSLLVAMTSSKQLTRQQMTEMLNFYKTT
jgi:hypothetical protein